MKIIPKGYVREKNNNPVSFDTEGNLVDQITNEKGTMVLPEITVRGISPETKARNYSSVYDRYALPNLINWGLENTAGKALQPAIEKYPWSANILKAITPSSYIGTLREGKAPWDLSNTGFGDSKDMQSANLLFDLVVGPKVAKGANKGVNAASTFVGKKYVTPYLSSRILNNSIKANPKGQILVSDSYFNSPNNWYRITNTPEVHGIKEMGKNVTTRDSGALIDVSSDNWRTSVLDQPLIRDKEGFLMLDPNRPNGIFDSNKIDWSPRLFQKSGSAHGNTSQASKGQVWQGGLSNSSMFPTIVIEGEAAQQVPMGLSRTNFKLSPWEQIPMGHRIGFKTGEMPMENLGYFQNLGNGKYSYQGQIIPDKRINMPETSINVVKENARKLLDQEWDQIYEAALNEGNTKKLKELRALHFQVKSGNDPQVFAHSTNNTFNQFDKSFFGQTDEGFHGSGFYFTTTRVLENPSIYKIAKGPNGEIPYMNYGRNKKYFYLKGNREYKVGNPMRNFFEEANTVGFVSPKDSKVSEVIVGQPTQIKSTIAITYDDNGNFIPLSKRDDFANPDFRYKKGAKILIKKKR